MEHLLEYSFFKKKEYGDIPMNFLYYNNRDGLSISSIESIFKVYLKIKPNTYLYIGRIVCNKDLSYAGRFVMDDIFEGIIKGQGDLIPVNSIQYEKINEVMKKFKKSRFNKKTWSEYYQDKYMDENFIKGELERIKKMRDAYKNVDPLGEEDWDD